MKVVFDNKQNTIWNYTRGSECKLEKEHYYNILNMNL